VVPANDETHRILAYPEQGSCRVLRPRNKRRPHTPRDYASAQWKMNRR